MSTNSERVPLTRQDLREELALFRDEIRTHYATKADLAKMKDALSQELSTLLVEALKSMESGPASEPKGPIGFATPKPREYFEPTTRGHHER